MILLAIEAASGTPSICLWRDAAANVLWNGEPRTGPAPILDAARNLLVKSGTSFGDLDAIACGRGPGAFTGVRLAVSLAQGLALGIGCPLLAVSELAALAWRAHREHGWTRVLTCLDARRGEVYWAAYTCDGGTPKIVSDEAVAEPGGIVLPPGRWALAGGGAPLIVSGGTMEFDAELAPDAEAIAALSVRKIAAGENVSATGLEPVYLRDRVASPRPKQS